MMNISHVNGRLKVEAVLADLRDMRRFEEMLHAAKTFLPESKEDPVPSAPEHESLRAIGRCLLIHFGDYEGRRMLERAVKARGASYISKLTAAKAHECRVELENMLPAVAA